MAKNIPLCELLTRDEAAKAAKLSPRTIDRLAQAGLIQKRYLGRSSRIWIKDLEKLPTFTKRPTTKKETPQ